ncbi:MAG: NFACT family protein [Chloroflexi bacterium]|nr:NFACT family protein [Chloroflexota bacterium]MCC6895523.1 NFACT family protein [Anaerolineae bacterium]
MYLDAFTIAALVDEFMDVLVGGRIQDVLDVDDTGIGMEVYSERKRRYLYLSADPQIPRIQLLDEKLRRGLVKPTQMGLLFRRYVEGGVIEHISQPPWERIMQFDVTGPEGAVSIVVEPMERRSNLLLLQKGIIVDCMRRVGPDENRYRLSLPAHEYKLPPPMVGKSDPNHVILEEVEAFFEQNEDPKRKTQQVLASRLLGVSPLLAKEITYRASGDVNQKAADADPDRIFAALKTLIDPLAKRNWSPGIAENENGVEAYSVYPIESLAGWHSSETLSEAITAYYGAPVGEDAYRAAKAPVFEAIREGQAKLGARLAALEKSMTDEEDREVLRQSGELILAYQYGLAKGQTELKAQYDADAPELVIKLNTELTPLENAQAYFSRYDKAKKALEDVPGLIAETRNGLNYLGQLTTDLEFATSWPEIDEVRQILQAEGHWRGAAAKKIAGSGQSAPLKVVTGDGFVIWVGRNSRQNENVTFGKGGGQDYWLHARGVPGAHVVVKFDGRAVPPAVLDFAASLAAYYSSRRTDGKVEVDVTRCLYVKKIKGAGQGMVTYRNEETVSAVPRSDKDITV